MGKVTFVDDSILRTPQRVRSEQTQNKLYEATCRLMHEYGYEYLTVQNICKLAGVTTGAFYHHFRSKDDILCLYLNKGYDAYIESLHITLPEDPLQRLTELCVLYAAHNESNGVEFVSNFYSTKNKSLNTIGMKPQDMYVSSNYRARYDCLLAAKETGLIPPQTDIVSLNEDICSLTKGIIFDWCLSGGSFHLTSRIRRLVDRMMSTYRIGSSPDAASPR